MNTYPERQQQGTAALTLYVDGRCPFCRAEMRRLQRWDRSGRLAFIDIAAADFDAPALGLEMAALDRELHSHRSDGQLLVGIDSMLAAYTLTGRGWLVAPLRVVLLRPALVALYRAFARNRYRLSRWLGYGAVAACSDDICPAVQPFLGK